MSSSENYFGAVFFIALAFWVLGLTTAVIAAGPIEPRWVENLVTVVLVFIGAGLIVGAIHLVAQSASERSADRVLKELRILEDEREEAAERQYAREEAYKNQRKTRIYWAGFLLLVFLSFLKDSDHGS